LTSLRRNLYLELSIPDTGRQYSTPLTWVLLFWLECDVYIFGTAPEKYEIWGLWWPFFIITVKLYFTAGGRHRKWKWLVVPIQNTAPVFVWSSCAPRIQYRWMVGNKSCKFSESWLSTIIIVQWDFRSIVSPSSTSLQNVLYYDFEHWVLHQVFNSQYTHMHLKKILFIFCTS